jgi:hypothetical protein
MDEDEAQQRAYALKQKLTALAINSQLGAPSPVPEALFGMRSPILMPTATTILQGGKKKQVRRDNRFEEGLRKIEDDVHTRRESQGHHRRPFLILFRGHQAMRFQMDRSFHINPDLPPLTRNLWRGGDCRKVPYRCWVKCQNLLVIYLKGEMISSKLSVKLSNNLQNWIEVGSKLGHTVHLCCRMIQGIMDHPRTDQKSRHRSLWRLT